MYAIIPQQIPQGKRAEINEKILFAINSGKDMIPAESIYNCYTGIGGLHNLKQSDFASYHEYAEAKKEFEMGQFFTPHEVCRDMVDVLSPTSSEMILDMCCGMGNFFNHLPNQHNAYGFDIDSKAVAVARYLYPDAHIDKCDIQQYHSEQRFDAIIGNPPFNLKFDFRLSQEYYIDKAYHLLNPAGFLMIIVPASFMQNEFWEKSRVGRVNEDFSFIGQTRLSPHAFTSVGVDNFNTKIMVFLRRSQHIEMNPYNAEEFVSMAELKERVKSAREMKHRLRLDLMRETNRIDKEELEHFEYKLAKYMYELKAHARLNKHIDKAVALVTKFRNQKPPENATNEQMKEWERKKLTTAKVLATIRKYITSQNVVPRKEVALVKTSYGFKLKQYAPRLLDKVEHKAASINDLILDSTVLPIPEIATEENLRQIRTDKLKSVATDAATALASGVSSLFGSGKMKSLERKNEDLRDEIAIRDETIEQLQSNIKQMEVEHQKQIQEVKQSYEAEHRKQSEYIDKILRYFPYVEKLMPMIKYLSEKMGFNDNLIKALCTFKEIHVKGKLYSTMFNQSFSADGAVCSLKEDKEGRFDLKIDGVSHHSWFRRKKDEFMEALGLPTSRRQNRGLKL